MSRAWGGSSLHQIPKSAAKAGSPSCGDEILLPASLLSVSLSWDGTQGQFLGGSSGPSQLIGTPELSYRTQSLQKDFQGELREELAPWFLDGGWGRAASGPSPSARTTAAFPSQGLTLWPQDSGVTSLHLFPGFP